MNEALSVVKELIFKLYDEINALKDLVESCEDNNNEVKNKLKELNREIESLKDWADDLAEEKKDKLNFKKEKSLINRSGVFTLIAVVITFILSYYFL